jgi:hypothetical protein
LFHSNLAPGCLDKARAALLSRTGAAPEATTSASLSFRKRTLVMPADRKLSPTFVRKSRAPASVGCWTRRPSVRFTVGPWPSSPWSPWPLGGLFAIVENALQPMLSHHPGNALVIELTALRLANLVVIRRRPYRPRCLRCQCRICLTSCSSSRERFDGARTRAALSRGPGAVSIDRVLWKRFRERGVA